jgi:glycosyltransferase involved in cell wall biosynthesis
VLHCAETIKGGIASYLRDLLPLQSAEFGAENVAALIPASHASELPLLEGAQGVRVALFDADQRGGLLGRIAGALALAWRTVALAREFQPTVVHLHSTFAGASVRPALWLGYRKARVVYCPHGWSWDRPMGRLPRYLSSLAERLLARMADQIVCISGHEVRTAKRHGLPATKLVLVSNAVNTRSPAPLPLARSASWPRGTRRVLFVGRFDQQKGVDVLWRALELLGPSTHAVIAGASVLSKDAAAPSPNPSPSKSGPLAAQPPANTTLVGWVGPGELETLFAQAEVLVVPSRWEGFGLVAAEAMRSGLPVIASAVGGLTEVVEHGVTGLLVEPGSPQALADAIQSLTPSDLARMGMLGQERVQARFTMPRLHRDLCAVYRSGAGSP